MDNFDCKSDYRMSRDTSNGTCCKERDAMPYNVSVAMAYVPFQQWDEVYSAEKALSVGTIFPCLNLPFVGCPK